MNLISRVVTGIFIIVLGLGLIIAGFSSSLLLVYGIPVLVVGFFIFFNKKEDLIEKIRRKK